MTATAPRREHHLSSLLTRLSVSPRVTTFGHDSFARILMRGDGDVDATLLEEGLHSGETALREVGEGDVNRVRVQHNGQRMLLLIDGEQIVGAKQDRVFNASFLVAPGSDVTLPVSCVERGRWRDDRRGFTASRITLTGLARSRKLSRVTQSILCGDGYDAGQGAVWADVDEYLDKSRIMSRTSAFHDGVASRKHDTQQKLAVMEPIHGQVGLALVRNDRVALMDVFGSQALYERAHAKVAAGMLADAADADHETADAARVVAATLAQLSAVPLREHPAPGSGVTLHGVATGPTGRLSVGAITHDGRIYHLVVAAA